MTKHITFTPIRLVLAVIIFMMTCGLHAQEKTENTFTLKAKVLSRGEFRAGGFKADALDNTRVSHFVIGSYRLTADYQRSWLELRLSPQHAGVWGQASGGVSIFEAWAKLKTENGWFAVRPSGTEDIYKIYAESFKGPEHLKKIQEQAVEIVDKVTK